MSAEEKSACVPPEDDERGWATLHHKCAQGEHDHALPDLCVCACHDATVHAAVPVPPLDGTVRIHIDVDIDAGIDSGDVADDISDAIANRPGRGGFSVAQIVVRPAHIAPTGGSDA